ncbi:MAG: hypothetical protein J5I81_05790 [Nitrococcus mobilis]|nr:hypothetical protein [Nitrococcus mobilis]
MVESAGETLRDQPANRREAEETEDAILTMGLARALLCALLLCALLLRVLLVRPIFLKLSPLCPHQTTDAR